MAGDRLGSGVAVAARVGRWAAVAALIANVVLGTSPMRAAEHDVTIGHGGFDPATLTVAADEPVTWTNATDGEHTVTSDDGTLDSGPIGPGEAYGHLFEVAGTFQYHDERNPAFTGTIVVTPAPPTPPPSGPPARTPPPGTLPPNFSPFPTIPPLASPAPAPSPTPAASPASSRSLSPSDAPVAPANGGSTDLGTTLGTLAVVVVIGGISTYAARAAARRRGRPPR